MPKNRRKSWSQSVGVYGSKVRVAELTPGGCLYLLWLDGSGRQHKRSLGHRDRKIGKDEALALAGQLARDRSTPHARLTISKLFDIYERHGLHGRTDKHRREVTRKLALWKAFLGSERYVDSLSPADVARFVEARKNGDIGTSRGASASISMTTIWHDYVALTTALHFALRHRESGAKPLLLAHPLAGVRVPKTVAPARPVASEGLYEALRAVAGRVNEQFRLALDLAFATGHRIDAILKLRWDDITLASTEQAPFGEIRWRAENDKIDNEHVVPMSAVASAALRDAQRTRPGIGEAWLFPSTNDVSRPVDRHLASRWLRRAENLANVEHVRGRGWHAFRRGWASARKHLPDVDVAAAGGWKDTATMKRCYQHADPDGVLQVVMAGVRRVSG